MKLVDFFFCENVQSCYCNNLTVRYAQYKNKTKSWQDNHQTNSSMWPFLCQRHLRRSPSLSFNKGIIAAPSWKIILNRTFRKWAFFRSSPGTPRLISVGWKGTPSILQDEPNPVPLVCENRSTSFSHFRVLEVQQTHPKPKQGNVLLCSDLAEAGVCSESLSRGQ